MGGSPAALLFVDVAAFWIELHAGDYFSCVRIGGAIRCTDSSRENALWQSCRLRWQKINIKRYGGSPTALFFVDAAAFRIGLHDGNQSTLAERFDAQIRVEKTPCGSRAVCVGKK